MAATCVSGNVDARQVAINTRAILELAGRPDVEVALGPRDAARPGARDDARRRTDRRGSGTPSCRRRRGRSSDASRRRPHRRRGAPTAGRDHPRHARPADQPGDRRPARAGAPPPAARLHADGRRVRRVRQHDPDDRVEHPLRPGGGEDRLPGLGRGARRPTRRSRGRWRSASTSPSRRGSCPTTSSGWRAGPAARPTTRSPWRAARTRCTRPGPWRATRSSATSPTRCASTWSSTPRYDGFYGAFIHDPLAVAAALDRDPGHDRGAVRRRRDARRAHGRDDRRGPAPPDRHGRRTSTWRSPRTSPAFLDRLIERVGRLAADHPDVAR